MNTFLCVLTSTQLEAIEADSLHIYDDDHADFVPLCSRHPIFRQPHPYKERCGNVIKVDFISNTDPLDPEPTLKAA